MSEPAIGAIIQTKMPTTATAESIVTENTARSIISGSIQNVGSANVELSITIRNRGVQVITLEPTEMLRFHNFPVESIDAAGAGGIITLDIILWTPTEYEAAIRSADIWIDKVTKSVTIQDMVNNIQLGVDLSLSPVIPVLPIGVDYLWRENETISAGTYYTRVGVPWCKHLELLAFGGYFNMITSWHTHLLITEPTKDLVYAYGFPYKTYNSAVITTENTSTTIIVDDANVSGDEVIIVLTVTQSESGGNVENMYVRLIGKA